MAKEINIVYTINPDINFWENDWINEVLKKHLTLMLGQLDDQTEETVDKILVLCNEQIVNLVKPNPNKSLMTTNFDVIRLSVSCFSLPEN